MTNLLYEKWNKLKEQIEQLKAVANNNPEVIMKIRKLKDEASVIRFAIEDAELFGLSNEEVSARMQANRQGYKDIWNY